LKPGPSRVTHAEAHIALGPWQMAELAAREGVTPLRPVTRRLCRYPQTANQCAYLASNPA